MCSAARAGGGGENRTRVQLTGVAITPTAKAFRRPCASPVRSCTKLAQTLPARPIPPLPSRAHHCRALLIGPLRPFPSFAVLETTCHATALLPIHSFQCSATKPYLTCAAVAIHDVGRQTTTVVCTPATSVFCFPCVLRYGVRALL